MALGPEEEERIQLGMQLFDAELAAIGEEPISQNSSFRQADLHSGPFPSFALNKPGVAPFGFVFGNEFEILLDPIEEVQAIPVSQANRQKISETIASTFRSSVIVRHRRWSTTVTLLGPSNSRTRLSVFGRSGRKGSLERFEPFARQTDGGSPSDS